MVTAESPETLAIPKLTDHRAYSKARTQVATEKEKLAELESELTDAESTLESLNATAGPNDLEVIEDQEKLVWRLNKKVEIQQRKLREAQAEVEDVRPEARMMVYEAAQKVYLKPVRTILDSVDAIDAALDEMNAIGQDYNRAAERQTAGRNPGDRDRLPELRPDNPIFLRQVKARADLWRAQAERWLDKYEH